MDSVPQKQCNDCKESFPITSEFFYRNSSNKSGFQGHCKQCESIRIHCRHPEITPRPNRRRNGEKECSCCREWYKANTDIFYNCTSSKDGLSALCKKCSLLKGHDNYANNAERIKSQSRVYSRTHKDAIKARRNNPKYKVTTVKRVKNWKDRNPEKLKAQLLRRDARERNSDGSVSGGEIKIQFKSQRGLCWWCGYSVGDTYHIDHRIALSKGGLNVAGNIVISCPSCNLKKNSKLPWEFNGRLL